MGSGESGWSAERAELVAPAAESAIELGILERRAQIPIVELHLEARERPHADIEALQEQRRAVANARRRSPRIANAHVQPNRSCELIAQARGLQRLCAGAVAASDRDGGR